MTALWGQGTTMKKITLTDDYILEGVFYHKGEHELPEAIADRLLARQAQIAEAEAKANPPIAVVADQTEEDRNAETGLLPLDYVSAVRGFLERGVLTPDVVLANLGEDLVAIAVQKFAPPAELVATDGPVGPGEQLNTDLPPAKEAPKDEPSAGTEATLNPKFVAALKGAGLDPFERPEELAAKTDDELTAIDGIGPAAVKAIRAYLALALG